jgi:hypothetical protein
VIVPQMWTVLPAPICVPVGVLAVQWLASLKYEYAYALAQLDPLPEPAADCAM